LSDFPLIRTERLLLREIVAADAPALLAIHGDAVAMRWFGTDPLLDLQEAEQLVKTFASWRSLPHPGIRWGIERQADGAFIGTCGLFKWNRGWKSCTMGYELAQSAWGQGYMHEALTASLALGFSRMALNRVEVQIHPDNMASLVLARKLGFVDEGLLRQAGYWLGQHQDLLQMALLRQDYEAGSPATADDR
jgi:[ribosomal protein S5]-alanine N-acetyltransferase